MATLTMAFQLALSKTFLRSFILHIRIDFSPIISASSHFLFANFKSTFPHFSKTSFNFAFCSISSGQKGGETSAFERWRKQNPCFRQLSVVKELFRTFLDKTSVMFGNWQWLGLAYLKIEDFQNAARIKALAPS